MPKIVDPLFEELIHSQKRFSLNQTLPDGRAERKNSARQVGEISVRDEHGKRRSAVIADCTCKGYYAVFNHEQNQELKKRLSFNSSGVPPEVKHVRDSLSRLPTASCPYCLTINKENEAIRCLHYGPGDEIVAARVVQVDSVSNIYIRIDLKKWAEIVVCSNDGSHIDRFMFNQEDWLKRKDIIAVSDAGNVIEEDYEHIKEDYTYIKWELAALREK
jgi:hypothetical protein